MQEYNLTEEAAEDIRRVVRYTLRQWGSAQVERYRSDLKQCLKQVAEIPGIGKTFSERLPDVRALHCRHHFIFYLNGKRQPPLVIAILHERQDLVARLADRLSQ